MDAPAVLPNFKLPGAVLACLLLIALATAAPASASLLLPPGKKVYFGVSDTGNMADFGHFSDAVHKHPAVIESFRTWGSDFPDSIRRWQTARARPMIHISTADNNDGHEIISLPQIAAGRGRPLPRPPQQALLRKGDARLRAAAGRAEPLPQRLRRLRLLGRLATAPNTAPTPTNAPSAAST